MSWTCGHDGFLAPAAPVWAGPHHLQVADSEVLDLASGDDPRPLREHPFVSFMASSLDGRQVVVSSKGKLYGASRDP
jgi:hypothetical protein